MIDFKSLLFRKVGMAVSDYAMIQHGDRILVAFSGGKDSFALLEVLRRLQNRAPVQFSLFVCIIHSGFPDYSTDEAERWLKDNEYEYEIIRSTIYESVFQDPVKAADGCFHCSRHRRSILYRKADEKGCHKIALGHHKDDFIESLLLSMMYSGRIETMLPVLEAQSGKFKIIRPLMYVAESTTSLYAGERAFPLSSCSCPVYEGSETLRRKKIKKILAQFENNDSEIKNVLFRSLSNFNARHMLDLRYNDRLRAHVEEKRLQTESQKSLR